MYYTGFADEASEDFAKQISATKELGWSNIESRGIWGKTLSTLTDGEFGKVCALLEESEVSINCYGSAIANWGKDPRKEEDFEKSRNDLKAALPRMEKLGIPMLRGMSFAIVKDADPDSSEIRELVFRKVRELVQMCEDSGVLYLHENCMNYGRISPEHTLRLLDKINSPNFKLVFDTGNPVITWDHRGRKPYKKQRSWDFYSQVKEFIHYIHIKDGRYIAEREDKIFPDAEWTFPGEGDGDVVRIVRDLLENGYDGGFSIEPHMAFTYHEGDRISGEEKQYNNYFEYGKRFMRIVEDIKKAL